MIWKQYYFKGNAISKKTADFTVGITNITPRTVASSDTSKNILGYHGVKQSPTFARARTIEIEGIIDGNSRANISKWMDYLDSLFALEGVPDVGQTYEFQFEDEQGRRWKTQCKIKDIIEYELDDDVDFIEGAFRKFRVVLEAWNSWYYSTIQTKVVWSEWVYWGFKLWVKLWSAMNAKFNEIEAISTWNMPAPCVVTISMTGSLDSPLYIKNSDWTFFGLDITAISGDVIVVDSLTRTAKKNGVNVLATRIAWSIRPTCGTDTKFFIYDIDQALVESDFDVEIAFNDILL